MDLHDIGIVECKLTWAEYFEYVKAYILSMYNGRPLACNMSAELEELLCTYIPSRHTILVYQESQ